MAPCFAREQPAQDVLREKQMPDPFSWAPALSHSSGERNPSQILKRRLLHLVSESVVFEHSMDGITSFLEKLELVSKGRMRAIELPNG